MLTIPPSGTVSNAKDLFSATLLGLIIPVNFTGSLKLQGSIDGNTFYDLYDQYGTEVCNWQNVTANAAYSVDVAAMLPYRFVRAVAGTAQSAVIQTISRNIA